jgi:uncharacterized FAD-dependent dehydrogenase
VVHSITFRLAPEHAKNRAAQVRAAAGILNCSVDKITGIRILRRSLDARGNSPKIVLTAEIYCGNPAPALYEPVVFRPVTGKKTAVIVGSGPAGLFAALELIRHNIRVTGLILSKGKIQGVSTLTREFLSPAVILATGHSARDIYYLLDDLGIRLAAKPYAMGVRVEHPQALINEIQYGRHAGNPHLPAASYALSGQFDGTGVYSFCMCPGGMLVPAATAPGELVLNGMSNSARNLANANAGMVVTVEERLWQHHQERCHFAGLAFQQEIEHRAFAAGGSTLAAPAQRLTDFLADRVSSTLPHTSYIPGVVSYPVKNILGTVITRALKQGFSAFGKKMKGYVTDQALVLAVESRTSSPVRIPRDPGTRMHPDIHGLFPAGEGSGYSGGIISSALDGQVSAKAAAGTPGLF